MILSGFQFKLDLANLHLNMVNIYCGQQHSHEVGVLTSSGGASLLGADVMLVTIQLIAQSATLEKYQKIKLCWNPLDDQ